MSLRRAAIITCDICGMQIAIKDDGITRASVPDGWIVRGANSFERGGEPGDATCPKCTPIVEAARAKYDKAVAEAKRACEEEIQRYIKTKSQADAEEENHHEQGN